ncbi:hypothetical protein [Stenotrophomonas sp. SY1]|uniref:hypothetical protein n=1 Tax=Stenotrophomonas sp. SY1 TaxID=477235 RepID=UPI001E324CAE|nr:hypothetical protein [Stenotrophomonas sp. SY1]MCD9088647.1 hypothetical protein [Stenotrophomonas sp. SY1]
MQSLIPLVQIQVILGFICGVIILCLQIRAYRKHKHKFFLTLANSTIFAFAASALASYPYFFSSSESQALNLYHLSIPLGALATILATWGSFQLFRSYDQK